MSRTILISALSALVGLSAADAAAATAAAPVATTPEKVYEEFSSDKRVGCAAQFQGYFFNLKELSMPINE